MRIGKIIGEKIDEFVGCRRRTMKNTTIGIAIGIALGLFLIFSSACVASMTQSRQGREYDKFSETSDGKTAVLITIVE